MPFKEYYINRYSFNTPMLLLRHDVDINPENALILAELEKSINVKRNILFQNC